MTVPSFPTLLTARLVRRTPMFSTASEPAISGKENRFPLWSYPRYGFELEFDYLGDNSRNADWVTLSGFYNSVFGPANPFLFTFDEDKAVTNQPFGVGDGTTRVFQSVRSLGGFTEPVFGILSSPTPVFKVDGVGASATYDSLGKVTFASAPASGKPLTWTGNFAWYCRFDDEDADFERFAIGFWKLGRLKFTTLKLP